MRRLSLLACGFAVLLGTVPEAQQPAPIRPADQPVFRLSVSLVQLDAVVTDKQGHHVTTLGRDDFEVYQDGRPQPVTAVSYIESDDGWVDTSGLPPLPVEALKPEDARRVIAVVVDDLRMSFESIHHARRGIGEFFDRQDEWEEWLEWMKALPFYLDLGGLRAVHATWHPAEVAALNGATLRDPDFLKATTGKGSPEFRAVETLLKGVELDLPEGATYADKDGHRRKAIRARWWESATQGLSYRQLVFPPADSPPDAPVPDDQLAALPGYAEAGPPVFFGHYWLPASTPPAPLRPNIACLDYSAAKDGPLVAYRWDGEQVLTANKFTTTQNHE